MSMHLLLAPIGLPLLAGIVALFFRRQYEQIGAWFSTIVSALLLAVAIILFRQEASLTLPWCAFGWQFAIRLYHFNAFILLATAAFGFMVAVYATAFMKQQRFLNQFYAYFLLTLGLVNGALLADSLILMLFFWEGLLLTLFGMIIIGRPGAFKTAIKACIISGVADLCMLVGIGLTITLAGTMTISQIQLPLGGWSSLAFICLMIGAIAKAGSMPFHSWIPDAALDAPLPFMALLPAALEKLLGIYFLARITLDLFVLSPQSWLSPLLMTIGGATIILAVLMALIQKDYKRLLSFHAISQVGYMILGIGTANPVGIVGGLFHMINHVIYKSGLFLTAGAAEKQAGTTDLAQLGGLRSRMPVTFICYLVLAASISGVPPFNGFFSKELVYDGALIAGRAWNMGGTFYLVALLGSFLTAASFLKLGHAAFGGPTQPKLGQVREAPLIMLLPMLVMAALCIFFGLGNAWPLENLILPVLGTSALAGHSFTGWPASTLLVILTLVVLAGALLSHVWGVKRSGSGLGAADHIHYAPGLRAIYERAERRLFDPYEIGLKIAAYAARLAWGVDRAIDYVYNTLTVKITLALTAGIRRAHSGSLSLYLSWALIGLIIVIILIMGGV